MSQPTLLTREMPEKALDRAREYGSMRIKAAQPDATVRCRNSIAVEDNAHAATAVGAFQKLSAASSR